jgi:hypothetical protein
MQMLSSERIKKSSTVYVEEFGESEDSGNCKEVYIIEPFKNDPNLLD